VRVDKQNKNAKTLVWVLQGRHRGTRESVLKLTAPWLDKAFSHTVKIRSHGPFTFAFAAAPEHPGFWRWQEGDAEQWLAVQAELTSVDSQTTHAFNEFVHIDPAFRKEFQELVAK